MNDFSIHVNLCGDADQKLMTECLEKIRTTHYNNFSFNIVSKYQAEYYPEEANMTIDAFKA